MSAAAVWDTVPAVSGSGRGVRRLDGRADLRLVPTRLTSSPARPPLHLTRFGRLLRTLGVLAVVLMIAGSVVGAGSASATIDHTVTVPAGQTLSAIASQELPQLSVAEGVAQIQMANDLSSSQVHAGQRLAIPSLR
ncbi:MAG: LysM peptidoglycan-binding domain-containing protein [Actinomycetota bacterium]|nr:LysM peptidoglycan-binding domain-containing protein [Actinomycetota bacterium]